MIGDFTQDGTVNKDTAHTLSCICSARPPNKSWRLYREYHSICLKQRGRSWAEDCNMKVGNLMNLDIYNSIHRSVDGITYLDQESDVGQGLDKLYNGGWVLIHNFRLSGPNWL